MNEICVSVIVPIYNVEKYLKRCLDSLVAQTLSSMELILVNDGTKDNSMKIVRRYEKKYPNIVVVEKENGGLSSARNEGLRLAKGEYVAFVDSDDYVLPGMFWDLYQNAKEYQADMVMSGYYRCKASGEAVEIPLDLSETLYEGDNIVQKILLPMTGALPEDGRDIELDMCVWRNLYRRDCILKHQIFFESEREVLSEDIIFHMELLPLLKKVAVVKKSYYHYVENPGSLTKDTDVLLCQRQWGLYREMKKRLQEKKLWEAGELRLKQLFWGRIRHMINRYVYRNRREPVKCLRYLRNILKEEILREVLREYPVKRMPLKSRIPALCMKYRFTLPCYLIFTLHAAE